MSPSWSLKEKSERSRNDGHESLLLLLQWPFRDEEEDEGESLPVDWREIGFRSCCTSECGR